MRWVTLLVLVSAVAAGETERVPSFSQLLKPAILRKVIEERDVRVNARLEGKQYSFYAAMLVRAELGMTRRILTDYQLYPKMVPYVNQAKYSPETQILDLQGGLWKYQVISSVRFEEKGDRWIHFKVVKGHFQGLAGDIFFEPQGEKGTAVFMRGEQIGTSWPPKLLVERGAEIVFGFTGQRMRSYIEAQKKVVQPDAGAMHDAEKSGVPTPRARF